MARAPDSDSPKAPSFVSSLRPALRFEVSGPWHLKHLSDRIARTWKLKSTFREACGSPPVAGVGTTHPRAANQRPERNTMSRLVDERKHDGVGLIRASPQQVFLAGFLLAIPHRLYSGARRTPRTTARGG